MSVIIKDMGKPKSCYAVIDGESEYCPFVNTDDDCVLQLKKGICEGTWADQYSKCPLTETPEPCEDAVSRKDCLKELSNMMDTDGFRDGWAVSRANVERMLKSMPTIQPEQRWMPVTERLPENNGEYIVTRTSKGLYRYIDSVKKTNVSGEIASDIIAWMPLPEPYKERREDG